MLKKILICIMTTSFFAAQGSQDKDYFIIEVKRKGVGAVNVEPGTGTLWFFTVDPLQAGADEDENALAFKKLNFQNSLTFPNSFIEKGYKWAQIIVHEKTNEAPYYFKQFGAIFPIAPGYHYLLSKPTTSGKTKICPNEPLAEDDSLCVTKTKI